MRNFSLFIGYTVKLIPLWCIIFFSVYYGNRNYDWFYKYKDYELNICERTIKSMNNKNEYTKRLWIDENKNNNKFMTYNTICGLRVYLENAEIINKNNEGFFETNNFIWGEDILINDTGKIRCYINKKSNTKLYNIKNYGNYCKLNAEKYTY